MITAEQFAEWKEHPVTREIYTELKRTYDEIKDKIANGQSIGADAQATHGLTNRAIGQLDGLNQLLNISFVDTEQEKEVNMVSGY